MISLLRDNITGIIVAVVILIVIINFIIYLINLHWRPAKDYEIKTTNADYLKKRTAYTTTMYGSSGSYFAYFLFDEGKKVRLQLSKDNYSKFKAIEKGTNGKLVYRGWKFISFTIGNDETIE